MSNYFQVYRSSAGSGKTFTLAFNYLQLVLKNQNPNAFKEVCALTFTNKAANEMKVRIIDYLKAFGGFSTLDEGAKTMQEMLCSSLKVEKEGLGISSKKVLFAMLKNYSDFKVTTLDKFVLQVVRPFSSELNLPEGFEVEMEREVILGEAVEELLLEVNSNNALNKCLKSWLIESIEEDRSWNLKKLLVDFAKVLFEEDSFYFEEDIMSLKIDELLDEVERISEEVKEIHQNNKDLAQKIMQKVVLALDEEYLGKRNSLGKLLLNIKNSSKFSDFGNITNLTEEKINNDLEVKSKGKNYNDYVNANKQNITDDCKVIHQNILLGNTLKIFTKNIYPTVLLRLIKEKMEKIKWENKRVHISEFNKKIGQLLFKEPGAYIYERIGEKYNHYLIDEFQDTSTLQWLNLLPLVENVLASGGSTLIVGDEKQAIYRFREGNAQQFSDLPNIHPKGNLAFLKEKESILLRNYESLSLDNNFRSERIIVDFNNEIFEKLRQVIPLDLQDWNHFQNSFKKETKGSVKAQVFEKETLKENDEENLLVKEAIKNLKSAQAAGYHLNDIAILSNTKENLQEIAEQLTNETIDFQSEESLLLFSSREVRMLYNFLQLLNDPNAITANYEILYHLSCLGFVKETYPKISRSLKIKKGINSIEILKNQGLLEEVFLNPHSPYNSLLRFWEQFEDRKYNAYVNAFLEIIFDLGFEKKLNLREILSYFEVRMDKITIKPPTSNSGVQLLTIHKSKGLEFKVAIVLLYKWSSKNTKDKIWIKPTKIYPSLAVVNIELKSVLEKTLLNSTFENEKNNTLLDRLNLLYVALTRASEHMFLIATSTGSSDFMNYLISTIKEIPSYNHESNSLEIGILNKIIHKSDEQKSKQTVFNYEQKELFSSNWKTKIKLAQSSHIPISKTTDEQPYALGSYLHYIASITFDINEIDKSLKKCINKFALNKATEQALRKMVHQLKEMPESSVWFSNKYKSLKEIEILDSNGKSFRPDLLLIGKDEIEIIDFKTGKFKTEDELQMVNYKSNIVGLFNKKVTAKLAYLSQNKIIEIA